MPLCCPSMLYGADKQNKQKAPNEPAPAHSVAVFAKHYQNSDMIDLRYGWHQQDQLDRAAAGLDDALPPAEGFREGIFNAATEW